MNKADRYFIDNLSKILNEGSYDENPRPKYKDGTPAYSKFITQVFEEYDISKGEYPIPTLRNTAIKMGIKEILWIYQKQSNKLKDIQDMGVDWWNSWDIGDGTIGQRYGATVKKWNLMNNLLSSLENDPFSRRHVMNLYQMSDMNETAGLYPCAYETLWSVRNVDGSYYLDLTLIQRSNDYIVANFINKVQYLALQMMVAGHLNYKVGKLCHFVENLHIYDRHLDAADEILTRVPFHDNHPYIKLSKWKNFHDYTIDDFAIYNTKNIKKIDSNLELAI